MFRIAETEDDILKAQIVRGIVFIEEQHCPYDEEIDAHDTSPARRGGGVSGPGEPLARRSRRTVLHVLGEVDGEPMASGRIRFLDDWAKLERIAVRKAWRGQGLGHALVDFMLQAAGSQGFRKYRMHAQAYLVDYYVEHGFALRGEMFQEAGIDHYLMEREDPPS